MRLVNAIIELYEKAATDLPVDVFRAIINAVKKEKKKSNAKKVFDSIIENIRTAKENKLPICQDTGMPVFYVKLPAGVSTRWINQEILNATRIATEKVPLRDNAVNVLNDKNTGNNIGLTQDKLAINMPVVYFEEYSGTKIIIDLLLKGGGSENVSKQYKLPYSRLKAGRDLKGVKKCVIDCVKKAKGFGCSPGIIGVAIGSPKDIIARESKKQLLRKIDDVNENKILDKFEKDLLKQLNKLNIGPMGVKGKTTVLGVKVKAMHRHPACFFVDISYNCWALRRKRLIYDKGKVLIK